MLLSRNSKKNISSVISSLLLLEMVNSASVCVLASIIAANTE